MYYDTQTEHWHDTRAALPIARGQTNGLRSAPDDLLASLGIISAVTDPTPEGMVVTGVYTIEIIDGVAHRVPETITQAEADSQAAAAQAAQFDALLSRQVDESDPTQGTARDQIIKIEGVVEWFIQAGAGITRPVKVAPTVQALNTFIEHLEAAEMWAVASKANRYATTLVAGISGFEKQGITAEQINAAWLYMGSPLPQQ